MSSSYRDQLKQKESELKGNCIWRSSFISNISWLMTVLNFFLKNPPKVTVTFRD